MTSAPYAPGDFRRLAAAPLQGGDDNHRRNVAGIVVAERAAVPREATR